MMRKIFWLAALAGLLFFAYKGWRSFQKPHPKPPVRPPLVAVVKPVPPPPPIPVTPVAFKSPRAAIVIDDVAYNLGLLDHYAALGVPLTFAILPGEKRAPAFSKKATQLGFAVIIHMPLQPIDLANNNPGAAGLYLNMTQAQMKKQFEKDIATIPDAVGLNNHMGSAFTENEAAMTNLLTWVKDHHLFFLDSRTSQKSVGVKVAKRLKLPYLVNQTFLDNTDEVEEIEAQLDKMIALAIKNKRTVAIGHYRRKYLLEALRTKLPEIKANGIELVLLPELLQK